MDTGSLGKVYQDGEIIIREGEVGNCMYVVQEGQVEIVREGDGEEFHIAMRHQGDFFGEMAIFDREVRSATVRAVGQAHVITVDKKNFLRRVHADPSLAFRLVETMSYRIRELNEILDRLRVE